jgi:competence protein ComEA
MNNPLTSLTHRERSGLAVAVGVLALFGIGSSVYRSRATPLEPTMLPHEAHKLQSTPEPSPTPAGATTTPAAVPPTELIVYVSGAVKRPGVYTLRAGQRLFQAIQRAGGFKNSAQQDALNLADHLKDGDQVHVPSIALASAPPPTRATTTPTGSRVLGRSNATVSQAQAASPEQSGAPTKFHLPGDGKVKLNSATQADLEKLPGVGPSTAQTILTYRQSSGGFKELEELKEVRGIGEKKFAKMQPFLSL